MRGLRGKAAYRDACAVKPHENICAAMPQTKMAVRREPQTGLPAARPHRGLVCGQAADRAICAVKPHKE